MGKIQTMVGKILSRKLMREQTILKTEEDMGNQFLLN
jgi:hypothetical protein